MPNSLFWWEFTKFIVPILSTIIIVWLGHRFSQKQIKISNTKEFERLQLVFKHEKEILERKERKEREKESDIRLKKTYGDFLHLHAVITSSFEKFMEVLNGEKNIEILEQAPPNLWMDKIESFKVNADFYYPHKSLIKIDEIMISYLKLFDCFKSNNNNEQSTYSPQNTMLKINLKKLSTEYKYTKSEYIDFLRNQIGLKSQ